MLTALSRSSSDTAASYTVLVEGLSYLHYVSEHSPGLFFGGNGFLYASVQYLSVKLLGFRIELFSWKIITFTSTHRNHIFTGGGGGGGEGQTCKRLKTLIA